MKSGQHQSSREQIEFLIRLLRIAKENGSNTLEGIAHEALGIAYQAIQKNEKAIEHQEMHLKITKQVKEKTDELDAQNRLGECYFSQSQYEKAIKHWEKVLDIAKEIGSMSGELIANGNLGNCYQCLGQYSKGIEYNEMSLNIAKQIGDKATEGSVEGNLGNCYLFLGQYNKAIEHYEMQLNIAKQIGDKAGEGRAKGNLGNCYQSLGQYNKAKEHYEMQLNIAKQIGDKAGEGDAEGSLGNCYLALGQYSKAIKHYEMQLNIAKQIGDKAKEGRARGSLGSCYYSLGQYNKAIEHHKIYLNIAKQIRDKVNEGKVEGNLRHCYQILGQYSKAIEHYEMQLNIAKQIGDKAGEGDAEGSLGNCYWCIGQYNKAIEHCEMQLNIAKQIGKKDSEAVAIGNLGIYYQGLGQYSKAIEHYEIQLNIAKQIGDKAGEGNAEGNLGTCYLDLGQYNKAIEHCEMQLKIAKQIGKRYIEGIAIGNLGSCYLRLGQYSQALQYLEIHLNFAKEMGDKEGEAKAYNNLGSCCSRLGQYDKAEEFFRGSVESYEKLFKNVPQQDQFKVSIIDTFISTYVRLVTILLRQKKKEEALVIAERGRSRALAELLVNARHPKLSTNVPEARSLELEEILQVVKALDRTVVYFALIKRDICMWVIQRDGNGIDVLPQDLNCQLDDLSRTSRLRHLLSLVEKATMLLNPSGTVRCEDRSLSFLYPDESKRTTGTRGAESPSTINSTEMPIAQQSTLQCNRVPSPTNTQSKQAAIMVPTSESKNLNMGESELNSVLKDLFQILFSPVRHFVEGSQVIVVPDGPIPLVPFAALIDGDGHYLAETLQVRLVPSLATAKIIMERLDEPGVQTSPLIVGDPAVNKVQKGGHTFPVERLPFAKEEAEMVGKLLNVEPLTAERATKESFLQKVESANLIHIASHGDMERGEILLAPSPGNASRKLEDVMLTITDLEHKRLRAKLVVLSCCHSGRGNVRAEGVIGIGRAFLGAGARAVLVTLWAVDDEATMYFMRMFYQYLSCGERASGVLNKTMKAMRQNDKFRHPRHWAPFVLIGEDVAPFGGSGP